MFQTIHSQAAAPAMYRPFPREREQRHAVAVPARLRPDLKLTIESDAGTDKISEVVVTDISRRGLSAATDGILVAGTRVMVEMPVIGHREAEIRWISDERAGCRFIEPLSEAELHAALCGNNRIARCFPGLMSSAASDCAGHA